MLFFFPSRIFAYEILYDFVVLLFIILFSKKISYLKINGVGLIVFIIVVLRLFLLGDNHSLQWTATASIAISQKIINQEYFNRDISVIAGYYSPKFIFSFILAKTSLFLKLDIINTYYLFKIIIVIFIPIFISYSLYALMIDKEKMLYIESNILRNFVIIFASAGILSRLTKLFYMGWPSFSNYNILNVTTEQSVSILLGFCGLFFLTYVKSKVFLIFFILSTFIHPVVGIGNYLIKVILCLNRKIIFLSLLKKELIFFIFTVCIPFLIIGLIWNENVINTSKFIDIYIVARHPHHYLVSYYFNYFSLIVLLFPLFLFVINIKESKELSFFSIIIFLFLALPILVQFIFIEIIPIKLFAKLGISRIAIFAYLLLFILTTITFQRQISALMNKFVDLVIISKFNKKFSYLYWHKSIYVILPLFVIFLFLKILPMNYVKISNEISLSKKLASLNLDNDKIIQFSNKISDNVTRTSQIRILSKTSVFQDGYFTFNEKFMSKWFDRFEKTNSYNNEEDLICYLKENRVDYYVTGKETNFESIYNNNKFKLISISDFSCN